MVTSMPAAIESEWPAVIPWENPTYTLMQGDQRKVFRDQNSRRPIHASTADQYKNGNMKTSYSNVPQSASLADPASFQEH